MKLTGRLAAIMLVCAVVFSGLCVSAQGEAALSTENETFRSSVDSQSGIVTITGSFPEMPDTVFAVFVYQADVTSLDGAVPDTLGDYLNHAEQIYTNSEGALSLTYKISGKTGKYRVFAVSADGTVSEEHYFVYIGNLQDYIDEIELCRSTKPSDAASRIKAVLDDEARRNAMGIYDNEIPGGMTFDVLSDNVFNFMANYTSRYNTAEDVCRGFKEAVLIYLINNAEADEIGSLVTENKALLTELDENILNLYLEIKSSDSKLYEKINDALEKYEISNMPDLCDAITEAAALQSVRAMNNYTEFMPFIEKINNAIGLDLDSYKKIKNTVDAENVNKIVVKNKDNYKTLKELKDEFYGQVYAVLNNPSGGGTTGGGSVSGGGKVSSGGYSQSVEISKPVSEITGQPGGVFKDLSGYEWCSDSVRKLYEKKIVSGDGNGMFRPADSVTRAELIKVLLECFDIYDSTAQTDFSDVHTDDWFYGYVATGHNRGFIKGMGNGAFGAYDYVTRQDMAVMAYNIALAGGVVFRNRTLLHQTVPKYPIMQQRLLKCLWAKKL